jgi:hypothetical protein
MEYTQSHRPHYTTTGTTSYCKRQHWILTGNPTLSISQPLGISTTKTTQEQESPTKRKKPELETEDSSEDSVTTYYKCYIPPDINESNAESVAREEEIQKRILTRKQKSLPDRPRSPPTQRQRVRDTRHTTNIVSIPPHTTSMTIDKGENMGNTPNEQVSGTSLTVPAQHCIEGSSLQSGKEEVDLSSSMSPDGNTDLSKCHNNKEQIIQQLVQTLTLDDLNPHGLYPNPDKPLPPQEITVLYDSGASITMLPGGFTDSWRNLRPSLMSL